MWIPSVGAGLQHVSPGFWGGFLEMGLPAGCALLGSAVGILGVLGCRNVPCGVGSESRLSGL